MTTMTTMTVATMMTMATMRTLEVTWGSSRLYTRRLEVVSSHITSNKEVGSYIALNDESWVTHSVGYLCRYKAALTAKNSSKSHFWLMSDESVKNISLSDCRKGQSPVKIYQDISKILWNCETRIWVIIAFPEVSATKGLKIEEVQESKTFLCIERSSFANMFSPIL